MNVNTTTMPEKNDAGDKTTTISRGVACSKEEDNNNKNNKNNKDNKNINTSAPCNSVMSSTSVMEESNDEHDDDVCFDNS